MEEAMLDCMVCGSRKWSVLEPRKAKELKTTGATRLRCAVCLRDTYWRVSDYDWGNQAAAKSGLDIFRPPSESPRPSRRQQMREASQAAASGSSEPIAAREARSPATATKPPQRKPPGFQRNPADAHPLARRKHYRVSLQLPVRVRVDSPELRFTEVTSTINVSRSGVYLQSDRPFAAGLPVYVALNYSPSMQDANIEQPARVVRVESNSLTGNRCVAIMLQ